MVEGKKKVRVAVLMGGFSSERSVSLTTGKGILESLDRDKYEAFGVDAAMLPGSTMRPLNGSVAEISTLEAASSALKSSDALASVQQISSEASGLRPDVVLIALHGKYGEDGTVQGMLELLGIPYTGSGVLASALAMDKSMAKKVLSADGIPVPESVDFICRDGEWDEDAVAEAVAKMGYPVIVKPSRQGSTIGMMKVNRSDELNSAIRQAGGYDSRILVEQFVTGMELTVGVLGNSEPFALPVIEIVPKGGFYDYEAKYAPGGSEHMIPARISEEATRRAREIALAAHKSLGCRGMSRTDIIYRPRSDSPTPDSGLRTSDPSDAMVVLEVNTIPGMTPTSLLPEAARAAGISFSELLDRIIGFALEEGTDR